MSMKPSIAFFGSSILSAYWNGAATYYRGLLRALARRGFEITFFEPNAYERQDHRDLDEPDWVRVVVYDCSGDGLERALDDASGSDVIVKASGVGVFDTLLEERIPELARAGSLAVFWDVDAPATLDRLLDDPGDPFHASLPGYDLVLTYGGGPPVCHSYHRLGARACVPIYNALDPETHHPAPPDERFAADLGFLGNRMPDRERRVQEFFLAPARANPDRTFLLGGSGWSDGDLPPNTRWVGHVYTSDHNGFNCTPLSVLNVSRESMARYGYSPATRVFEAAGAGACLVTDAWKGIEQFLEPGREVLVAANGQEVSDQLRSLTPERSRRIGFAARRRVLAEHTYEQRAEQVERVLEGADVGALAS
jgi:spore maturation protein CgeB